MNSSESARLRYIRPLTLIVSLTAWCAGAAPCQADVITDWDTKAIAVASPGALGEREAAIVDLAMFDAVNSIARQHPAYLVREPGADGASPEAAAASAAATALARLHPEKAADFKTALDDYSKGLSDSHGDVAKGMLLGERVALRLCDSRATDGAGGVGWPSHLAERLATARDSLGPIAVVNAGIGGNRLLRDGSGASALARFDRDVLAVPGVAYLILLEGINDIGWPGARATGRQLAPPAEAPDAQAIIAGYDAQRLRRGMAPLYEIVRDAIGKAAAQAKGARPTT